ncbi:MAG: NfeD family protein [Kovacikia sp.]
MFNMISLFNAVSLVEIPEIPDASNAMSHPEVMGISPQNLANKAVVTRTIAPGKSGQVKFQGTWWNARCEQNIRILPGQTVYVLGESSRIPLLVEPAQAWNGYRLSDAA